MASNLKMIEVFHLSIVIIVKSKDFFHEVLVWFVKCFTIFFDVQNCSGFRFNLVDISVINISNSEWLFLSLSFFFSLCLLYFSRILSGESQFSSNTVLEMASLFLPEFFQVFSFSFREVEFLISDHNFLPGNKCSKLCFIEFITGDGNITFVFISSWIDDLNLVKFIWDYFTQVFPVYLVFGICCLVNICSFKMYN